MEKEEELVLKEMLEENVRRTATLVADWDPISGRGSVGERIEWKGLWIPKQMLEDKEMDKVYHMTPGSQSYEETLDRVRIRHDFPYWAAKYARIKPKRGGEDISLVLNYAQRKLVDKLEKMRIDGKPIRLIVLKARQWGGSTCCQLYMAWLQLVHARGFNSLIIAHQTVATSEIKDMYDRMMISYPRHLLYPIGMIKEKEPKMVSVGTTGCIFRVPARNCKVKIGTAESPHSCRGGDYALVHLSEVGLWRSTPRKKAEDLVRSACSGVLYEPLTMVVYESTANGIGNFFHREYKDACNIPDSQFSPLFISWFEIEQNRIAFASENALLEFARKLYRFKDCQEVTDSRHESGAYLWWLWNKGATLEGIYWYCMERAKHTCHDSMASECPSDDVEAFANSGANVFDKYKVEAMRKQCLAPLYIGEIDSERGDKSVSEIKFAASDTGMLWVWEHPDCASNLRNRYLVAVDIGGVHHASDWSVIVVIDRAPMMRNEPVRVVAQWRGHEHIDILGWKAARIAKYYCNALLVIESNTLEHNDASGVLFEAIKDAYGNLYRRRSNAEDVKDKPKWKYGFHTNVKTKVEVINWLLAAVRDMSWIERDERCLDELLVYERRSNGSYGAAEGKHDDILMTRAIALYVSKNMDAVAPERNYSSIRSTNWF